MPWQHRKDGQLFGARFAMLWNIEGNQSIFFFCFFCFNALQNQSLVCGATGTNGAIVCPESNPSIGTAIAQCPKMEDPNALERVFTLRHVQVVQNSAVFSDASNILCCYFVLFTVPGNWGPWLSGVCNDFGVVIKTRRCVHLSPWNEEAIVCPGNDTMLEPGCPGQLLSLHCFYANRKIVHNILWNFSHDIAQAINLYIRCTS